MSDFSEYISREQSMELSHSSSESSSQMSSHAGVFNVINWINELFAEDDSFSKISSLKNLADGEVFLQIIHSKFQYLFEDENSFYDSPINYALIRQFLVKELSIKISINYDYAFEGDEMELGKIAVILMLSYNKAQNLPLSAWDDQLLNAFRNSNIQTNSRLCSSTSYANSQSSVMMNDLMSVSKKEDQVNIHEFNEDAELSRCKTEIAELRADLNTEKFKSKTLELANMQLEEQLKDEEAISKKWRARNKDLKTLVKRYEEELVQFKQTLDTLNEDYELIVTEIVQMKRTLVEKNNVKRHQQPNQMLAITYHKLDSLPANNTIFSKFIGDYREALAREVTAVTLKMSKVQEENQELRTANDYYKGKYKDLKKHIVSELNTTIDDITKKNESILVGNAAKLRQFEMNMQRNLKHFKDKYKERGDEIKRLESSLVRVMAENETLKGELSLKTNKIREFEKMNQELVDFIKMQADEIIRLDEDLKEAKFDVGKMEKDNGELVARMRSLELAEGPKCGVAVVGRGLETISECSERQVKELYDTITEVFIERIEELKNEVDELRAENKQLTLARSCASVTSSI